MTALVDLTSIDLVSLINVKLKYVAATGDGEYEGPCPFCGGTNRLRVQPNSKPRPSWWCRSCGGDRWHDAIDFVRQRDSVGFLEACQRLQITPPVRQAPLPPAPPALVEPPSDTWQEAATRFVVDSMATLHRTDEAKRYLEQRGLTFQTYVEAGLGYNPNDHWVPRATFGLPPQQDALGLEKQLFLPRGIVIPWVVEGRIWKVTIRRFLTESRYHMLPGGSNALYGVDTITPGKPVVITEGVFDALAVKQEAGDLVAAVATGTSWARSVRSIAKLARASVQLASHDVDKAGDDAALYWTGVLGATAKRWEPLLKDPGEMLSAGFDIRQWG